MLSTEAVASTLYEALAHFRQQLHSQHQEHESSRPRNGKNRATEADEEVEAQRRLQLEAVENCLSAVPQMASVFSKPPSEKILAPAAQASSCDGPEVVPITLAEEEPYINPFTGLMVYPESKYRPGPSGTQPLSKNPTPHPQPEFQPANRERENIWIEELEPRSEPARPFPGTAPNLPQAISLQSPPETSGHDVLFYGYEAPPNYSEISLALEPVEPSRVKEQTNPSTTNSKSWGQILGLRGGKVKKSTAQKIQGKAPGVVELDAGKPPLPQKIPDSAVQPSTADLKPKRATLSVRQNRKAQPRSLIDQSVADPRTVEVLPDTTLFQNFTISSAPPFIPEIPPVSPLVASPDLTTADPQQSDIPAALAVRNRYGGENTTPTQRSAENPSNGHRSNSEGFMAAFGIHWPGGFSPKSEPHEAFSPAATATPAPAPAPTAEAQQRFSFLSPSWRPSSTGPHQTEEDEDLLLALRLQRQEAEYEADRLLAQRLAATENDDFDSGYQTAPEDAEDIELFGMTQEMLEEQRSLLAAFAAQAAESVQQEEYARTLQREFEDEHRRQIEEQAAFARRMQEEWADTVRAQEAADRELAEQIRRQLEEEQMREEEALEEVRRMVQAEQEEEERLQREEEERVRRERMAECVVCADEHEKTEMLVLPCEHAYCASEDCLHAPFRRALREKQPFRCCDRVDIDLAAEHFDAAFVADYKLMLLERDTPNPLYCSVPACSRFIVPASIKGGVGTCPACSVRTCAFCRLAEHGGVCREDAEGQRVRALARAAGWKVCPNCQAVVERNAGCLHMTCRCGTEFCYSCNALYSQCPGTCSRL